MEQIDFKQTDVKTEIGDEARGSSGLYTLGVIIFAIILICGGILYTLFINNRLERIDLTKFTQSFQKVMQVVFITSEPSLLQGHWTNEQGVELYFFEDGKVVISTNEYVFGELETHNGEGTYRILSSHDDKIKFSMTYNWIFVGQASEIYDVVTDGKRFRVLGENSFTGVFKKIGDLQ